MIARHLAQGHIHPEKLHAYQILSPFLKLHLRHKSCTLPIVLAPPLL